MRIIFHQSQAWHASVYVLQGLISRISPSSSLTITVLRCSNDIGPRTWRNRRRTWNASLLLGCTVYTLPKALPVTYPGKSARGTPFFGFARPFDWHPSENV
ncbi:hypothetical protein TNCV_3941611 [Trichonephila clavipes]|uniref:Uncharacterized protein n=1 Tax=Trichonephila clavipes TaxID=2585209 RepID=A0A8X6VW07_TRICX|nr:hypothetical protein TNCV_3941611 [Trichonephila clavipes]